MKRLIINIIFVSMFLTSCSTHNEVPVITPVTTTPPPELPAITETDVNLDLELQDKLKGIWKDY